MKLLFLGLVLFTANSFAGELIITKSSSKGRVAPGHEYSEKCNVYTDRVEIFKTTGPISTKHTLQIETTGLETLAIQAANEEVIETPSQTCDAPGTEIATIVKGERHVLYSTGGCGMPAVERKGNNSRLLAGYVSKFCRAMLK